MSTPSGDTRWVDRIFFAGPADRTIVYGAPAPGIEIWGAETAPPISHEQALTLSLSARPWLAPEGR